MRTAHLPRLVRNNAVSTLVYPPGPVEKGRSVPYLTMPSFAPVQPATQVNHSHLVILFPHLELNHNPSWILASHPLVDLTVNARAFTSKQFVLAIQEILLERHQTVDQSASFHLIVRLIRHVCNSGVLILVWMDPVPPTLSAELSTTAQFVAVQQIISVIHSLGVNRNQ